MSYSVWTINPIDDETCVLADIPTHRLAEKLVARLLEIYNDDRAWVEQD